jgi:hypothetical protein
VFFTFLSSVGGMINFVTLCKISSAGISEATEVPDLWFWFRAVIVQFESECWVGSMVGQYCYSHISSSDTSWEVVQLDGATVTVTKELLCSLSSTETHPTNSYTSK